MRPDNIKVSLFMPINKELFNSNEENILELLTKLKELKIMKNIYFQILI